MRYPRFKRKPRLTVRLLMGLVAIVAIAIWGWRAERHWAECRKGEWIVRDLGFQMKEYALTAREEAEEIEENPKDFEAGSPEGEFVREEWAVEFPATEMATGTPFAASLRRKAEDFDTLVIECERFERRYRDAALRPWVDVELIDRDFERMKLEYRQAHDSAEPAAEEQAISSEAGRARR